MQKWEYLVVYIQGREFNQEAEAKTVDTTATKFGGDVQANAEKFGVDAHASADKFTETLNKYASGGWELMTFEWDGDRGAKALFKRPRG